MVIMIDVADVALRLSLIWFFSGWSSFCLVLGVVFVRRGLQTSTGRADICETAAARSGHAGMLRTRAVALLPAPKARGLLR
jgi:hypothetical protein